MFASEAFLGVRPAAEVTYMVIASPAGAYFPGGVRPVSIWLSQEYTRAAPGGTGAAKCGGNYAASLCSQAEASEASCDQVVFLDAVEHRWVEELGGMNLFFVRDDGSVVTPELSGTILEGVTRDSIITLLREQGHEVVEAKVDIAEWREGVASGRITEVFACGTAAVVTPVGRLVEPGAEHVTGTGETGEVTTRIRTVAARRAVRARGGHPRLAPPPGVSRPRRPSTSSRSADAAVERRARSPRPATRPAGHHVPRRGGLTDPRCGSARTPFAAACLGRRLENTYTRSPQSALDRPVEAVSASRRPTRARGRQHLLARWVRARRCRSA